MIGRNVTSEMMDVKCRPEDIACKSVFLGPKSENQDWLREQVRTILDHWILWRERMAKEGSRPAITEEDRQVDEFGEIQKQTQLEIQRILKSFDEEIPKHLPSYVGHMFSEISMPALLGQMITLCHNPNNISVESSRVGTRLESEALTEICREIGFSLGQGHFTSCGTIANFEFLFRARERWAKWLAAQLTLLQHKQSPLAKMDWDSYDQICSRYGEEVLRAWDPLSSPFDFRERVWNQLKYDFKPPVLVVSGGYHYSWPKAMKLMGLGEENLVSVPLDSSGKMSLSALAETLEDLHRDQRSVLGVVAIQGSTELGAVDPLDEICELMRQRGQAMGQPLWLHVDGAYGGYFSSMVSSEITTTFSPDLRKSLGALSRVDSMTIDPHKLGYVPYSSGAFLCKEIRNYQLGSHWGPYLQVTPEDRGPYTLEGSRSAAGAVGTLLTLRALRPVQGYARILARGLRVKSELQNLIGKNFSDFFIPQGCETNILCIAFKQGARSLSHLNRINEALYLRLQAGGIFTFSKTVLSSKRYGALIDQCCQDLALLKDSEDLFLIRMTLMNPFLQTLSGDPHLENLVKELEKFQNVERL